LKVLIIGSGGREHALAECFAKSEKVSELFVAPGNAGIAMTYNCLPLLSHAEITTFCLENSIDMVFIGPEQPISEGLSDELRESGIQVIAPSRFAAKLETSKIFAKQLMQEKGIPTAKYKIIKDIESAEAILSEFAYPVVIKADGLAAGKGVIIAEDYAAAMNALDKVSFNKQGVIAEEFLYGWEVSLFALCDGWNYQSTIFAQDHKQLYDHDLGPNTGGMGAYAPVPKAVQYQKQIENEIISPILTAMREKGYPYQGVLYCGLMITATGPKVIEFNCRFGDPEAQVLLPLLETDFVDICQAILTNSIDQVQVKFKNETALGVVMASKGYPGSYAKGFPITMPDPIPEGLYFSGVAQGDSGLQTAGGRVLCVVGIGNDGQTAKAKAYKKLESISFEAKTYRCDIGGRENIL